jgi:RNA polymerase sigma-70 factor (ECF subfamily)
MTSDEATLARLMRAAQAGDALAYRQLLGMAAPLLMRWFRRKVAPADLDDLVQDTLLAVHQRRASWDPARPFLPWLAAIARYRWVDRLRRARVRDADALFDDIAVESGEAALIGRLGCDRLLALLPGPQAAAIRAVQNQGWQQGWQQPPPVQVVHTRTVVPVPVPVAYGGWGSGVVIGGGFGGGWNRGVGGGWGGGRGWGRCRGTGGGALVGGIAGASIGYGLGNRWDRTPGVIIGGLVGALAGSAIERSGC